MNANKAMLLLLIALPGCVSPAGNGVLRSTADLPQAARMMMAPNGSAPSAIHMATEAALVRLGYRFDGKAEFVVDHAYSERPLGVSFESDGGLHTAEAKLPNLALCVQRIHRLALVIIAKKTGQPVYQGHAEITQCAGLADNNATRLANAAVSRLAPPLARP
jgi:hypothetical protein